MASPSGSPKGKKIALLFPGQGSQYPGMGSDLHAESTTAKATFEAADRLLGYSLTSIMAGDRGDDLNRTVYTQPAVLVHSVALFRELQLIGDINVVVAGGHSLGEYSALCAAGVIDFEEALDLVRIRAEGMDAAQAPGECGMAAVMGPSSEQVRQLTEQHRGARVIDAVNYNAPDQTVISGHLDAVERCIEAAKSIKRARTVMLPVSSAFHTSLMEPAKQALADRLQSIRFRPPLFPVVSNVTGQIYPESEDEAKELLVIQIVRPVRWVDCVQTMLGFSPDLFLETGPGKVLGGLMKRIDRKAAVTGAATSDDIRSLSGEPA
jgi:[acyl-carrier-protein] S-malonyltransferase